MIICYKLLSLEKHNHWYLLDSPSRCEMSTCRFLVRNRKNHSKLNNNSHEGKQVFLIAYRCMGLSQSS